MYVIREDLELINPRGHVLKCSRFIPCGPKGTSPPTPTPCVVYCHGNAGCRLDALSVVPVLLPEGISVFAFDFSGAGLSDGECVSLPLPLPPKFSAGFVY